LDAARGARNSEEMAMALSFAAKHTYLRRDGDVMILRPRGNLVGSEESDELDRLFEELREDGVRNVVLNLSAVAIVNSLAMSRLVRSHLRFAQKGGQVALCELDRRVHDMFVITKLTRIMRVFTSEDAAVAGVTTGPL
jgi:stage II sporulation protein AA (anti-sigma F factor antagonist)